MKWFGSQEFYAKSLTLSILLVSIIILGVACSVVYIDYTKAVSTAVRLNETRATLLSKLISEHERAAIGVLRSYARRPLLIDATKKRDFGAALKHLIDLSKNNPEMDWPFITNPDSTAWVNYPVDREGWGKDLSYRDWYKGVSKQWKPYISSAYKMIVGEEDVAVAVCTPIFDEKEEVIGILSTAQRVAFFRKLIEDAGLDLDATVTLIDQEGRIIYSNRSPYIKEVTGYPRFEFVSKAMKGEKGSVEVRDACEGDRIKYISFVPMEGIGWTTIVEKPKSEVLRTENSHILTIGIITALACGFLILLLFHTRGRHRQIEEHGKLNEELDGRVHERTEELSGANESLHAEIMERKQAEKALQEAHDRAVSLGKFPKENPNPVLRVSSEGIVLYCNPATARSQGWNCETGQTIQKELLPLVRQALAEQREVQQEVQLDGRFYRVGVVPIREKDYVNVYGRDITVRKAAEEEARKSNEELAKLTQTVSNERQRLFDILETLPVMVCLLTPDYHVAFANRTFREKFGVSSGRHCYEYCCGLTAPCAFCESFVPLKTGKPLHWEFHSPDGKTAIDAYDYPFTDIDGSPLILEMAIDITERKRAEEALRESEEKFRAFVSSSSEVVYRMSPDWKEMRHLEGKEFIPDTESPNRTWLDKYLHPDDQPHVLNVIHEAIRTKSVFELEHRVLRVDGSLGWTYSRAVPLLDANGDIVEWLGTAGDITARKLAGSERERLLAEVQAERERLSALVASIEDEVWFADKDKHFTLANPAALREFALGSGEAIDVEKLASSLRVLRPDGSPRPVEEAPPLRALKGEVVTNQEEIIETPARGELRHRQVSSAPVRDRDSNIIGSVSVVRDITQQKHAEMALREAEQKYRELVQFAPAAIYEIDFRTRRFLSVNDAMCQMAGYSREELLTMNPFDLLDEPSQALFQSRMARWLNGEEPGRNVEYKARAKDGRMLDTILNVTFTVDANGKPLGATVVGHDITERKRMEEELRKSRDELELRVRERTTELEQTNEQLREENQERLRTEELLRLEEARLEALLQLSQMSKASLKEITNFTLDQAIILTESEIGFLGFLNEDETVYTLHAVSKDVVKECNVTGDPSQGHVVDAGIWASAIRERKTLFLNDYSKPHPEKKGLPPGHPHVERFMVVPIFDGKRIVALAGVGNKPSNYDQSDERQIALLLKGMWDYAQKMRSREELENAYQKLEKSNYDLAKYNLQLKALNQELQDFAFVASHDLNEPLRKIQAFGDLVTKRLADFNDEPSKDYLKRMQSAAARMQNLLNSLLSYSRVTTKAEPMKKTELRRSVKDALSNLEIPIGEKKANIEIGCLPTIEADVVQMTQLFQNLIGNAVKFHRDGEDPHVKIYAKEMEDAHEIYVQDNGIGFDEKYLDKIFLPFQRLHGRSSEYQGVGMGLAICRKIVERHGGKITAKSELGQGSTFIVTLPAGRNRE